MSSFKTTRAKIVYGLVATLFWAGFFYFNVYRVWEKGMQDARANSRIIYHR